MRRVVCRLLKAATRAINQPSYVGGLRDLCHGDTHNVFDGGTSPRRFTPLLKPLLESP
jgi:hypothetical protein